MGEKGKEKASIDTSISLQTQLLNTSKIRIRVTSFTINMNSEEDGLFFLFLLLHSLFFIIFLLFFYLIFI
jgi:hypothetical protein